MDRSVRFASASTTPASSERSTGTQDRDPGHSARMHRTITSTGLDGVHYDGGMLAKKAFLKALLMIVIVGLLALPASVGAQPSIKTSVEIDGLRSIVMGGDVIIFGHVSSPNPKCVAGRSVKVFAGFPDDTKVLLDTGRSGTKGYWATAGDLFHVTKLTARVARKSFGPRKHRKTCAPASNSVPVLRR